MPRISNFNPQRTATTLGSFKMRNKLSSRRILMSWRKPKESPSQTNVVNEDFDDDSRPDVCARCGIKTHHLTLLRRVAISNDDVFEGICIRCNTGRVPSHILEDWKNRNAPTAPMEPGSVPNDDDCKIVYGKRKEYRCRGGGHTMSERSNRSRSRSPPPPPSVSALTTPERNRLAKRACLCARCGIQTHGVGLLGRTSITNEEVHRGKCIRCHPESVPSEVLAKWKAKSVTTAPSTRLSTSINSFKESFRTYHGSSQTASFRPIVEH